MLLINPSQATRDAAGILFCVRIMDRMDEDDASEEARAVLLTAYNSMRKTLNRKINVDHLIDLADMTRNYWSPIALAELNSAPRLVAVNG